MFSVSYFCKQAFAFADINFKSQMAKLENVMRYKIKN